jgi:hypothetical protein
MWISQLSVTIINIRGINLEKEKVYFGSQVLKFQAMISWLCGKAAHHGRNVSWNKTTHLMARKQERKKRVRVPTFPSRAGLKNLKPSPCALSLKGSTTSSYYHLGTKLLIHGTLGDTQNLNCTIMVPHFTFHFCAFGW